MTGAKGTYRWAGKMIPPYLPLELLPTLNPDDFPHSDDVGTFDVGRTDIFPKRLTKYCFPPPPRRVYNLRPRTRPAELDSRRSSPSQKLSSTSDARVARVKPVAKTAKQRNGPEALGTKSQVATMSSAHRRLKGTGAGVTKKKQPKPRSSRSRRAR